MGTSPAICFHFFPPFLEYFSIVTMLAPFEWGKFFLDDLKEGPMREGLGPCSKLAETKN